MNSMEFVLFTAVSTNAMQGVKFSRMWDSLRLNYGCIDTAHIMMLPILKGIQFHLRISQFHKVKTSERRMQLCVFLVSI